MVDAREPNYSVTISQIEELKLLLARLEESFSLQLPQGITNKFLTAKDKILNWVDEAEFTLGDYIKYD